MATHTGRLSGAKSTSRISLGIDWGMITKPIGGWKESMSTVVSMLKVKSNKKISGKVLVVDLANYLPMDISALKRKLKRRGIVIHKTLCHYGGMVREMCTINSKDARNFLKGEQK